MQWIAAGVMAGVVTAAFYVSQLILQKRYLLELKHRGRLIKEKSIGAVGALTFLGTLLVCGVRLEQLHVAQKLLTVFLLYGLSVLTIIDMKKQLVPNKILFGLFLIWTAVTGITVLLDVTYGFELLCRSIAGAAAGGLIFFICYVFSKGQLGAGDVKLAAVMGLYLTGDRIMGAVLYGTLLCLCYSLIQLARRKLTLKSGVPMVPFLFMGTIITLLIM